MKKIILMIAVAIGSVSQINAQNITGGVKANANMSNFILSDMAGVESKMKVGASIGGLMNVRLSEAFSLQPELLLHMNFSEFKNGNVKSDFQYWGLELPVYFMGKIDAGKDKAYIGVGPYVGVGLSAQNKVGGTKYDLYKKSEAGDMLMQRFDFGFGAQLMYEFDFGMFISGAYKIGVINALDSDANGKMLPQMVSLGVGYKF